MKKRIIGMIMALVMMLSLVPTAALAENVELVDLSVKDVETTFNQWQPLRRSAFEVCASYSDGTQQEVNDFSIIDYDSSQAGKQTLKIVYKGIVKEHDITVTAHKFHVAIGEDLELSLQTNNVAQVEWLYTEDAIQIVKTSSSYTITSGPSGSYAGYVQHATVRGVNEGVSSLFCRDISTGTILAAEPISSHYSIKDFSLDKDEVYLRIGDTVKLNATYSPSNANMETNWYCENNAVALIDPDGTVTATNVGTTCIHAQLSDGLSEKTCVVHVVEPTTTIETNVDTITLTEQNKPQKIETHVLPVTATVQNVRFQSQDEQVATVNENGEVFAIGNGTTNIVITSVDGFSEKRIPVTVILHEAETLSISITELSPVDSNNDTSITCKISPQTFVGTNLVLKSSDASVACFSDGRDSCQYYLTESPDWVVPVKLKKEGTVTITACMQGTNASDQVTFKVAKTKDGKYVIENDISPSVKVACVSDNTVKITLPYYKNLDSYKMIVVDAEGNEFRWYVSSDNFADGKSIDIYDYYLDEGATYTYYTRAYFNDGTCSKEVVSKETVVYRPQISLSSVSYNSIKIKVDKPLYDIMGYAVFYRSADGKSWERIGTSYDYTYTDTGLQCGKPYYYKVRFYYDAINKYSAYSDVKHCSPEMSKPIINSVANSASGVTVKWAAVSGAAQYRVFYKTSDSGWKKFADTTGTSMTVTGLTSNTEYSFTVRCLSKDGKSFTSGYDTTGKSITYVAAPVISSVSNAVDGVTVKWNAVAGAGQYRVYYKTGSGSWTKFGDTTGTSLTVTGLSSGTKYSFTVRCLSADGKSFTSSYDNTGKSITYVAAPVISSVANAAKGVTVKWAAVSGAAQYRVFYKTADSGWKKFADTTGTSLTVTGLTSNTEYSFTVRCLSKDGKSFTSGYDTTGKSITYVTAPVISSVTNATNGVTVKWGAVSGAGQYRVYYKTGSGSWTKFGDTTGTSLTVTGLTSGTKYSFTVRCLSADGKSFTSSYDNTGKSITYVAAPAISSVANAAKGVTVKWGAVSGAAQYRVFYKTADSGWKKFGDTTGTSMTVTGLTSNTEYSFTVRCLSADGKSFTSGYDTIGMSIMYIAAPAISSVTNATKGVTVKWGAVSGAGQYRVYYKTGSGSWTKFGDTTDTSLTVTGLTSGTKYSFTVRCLSADGKSFTSSYDNTGKSITYLSVPTLGSATTSSTGITVKWSKVTGASGYYVYRKTSSSGWSKIGTVSSGSTVSFKDANATKGTTYIYTVRAYSGSTMSGYNATGVSAKISSTTSGSTTPATTGYILNTDSMKFHNPSCVSAEKISAENRQESNLSRNELIARGYTPCKNCNP